MFRMSHTDFLNILENIGSIMERDLRQSEKAGGYISPSMQLDGVSKKKSWLNLGRTLSVVK